MADVAQSGETSNVTISHRECCQCTPLYRTRLGVCCVSGRLDSDAARTCVVSPLFLHARHARLQLPGMQISLETSIFLMTSRSNVFSSRWWSASFRRSSTNFREVFRATAGKTLRFARAAQSPSFWSASRSSAEVVSTGSILLTSWWEAFLFSSSDFSNFSPFPSFTVR